MKTIRPTHYEKTYGVVKGVYKGETRFFVVSDGKKTSLHYAKASFAMQKAKDFTMACYRDFIDMQGNHIKFTFKQV
jgi:hypothetical protein